MKIKIFRISAMDPDSDTADLNNFIGNRKILEIQQEFCHHSQSPFWTVMVKYIEQSSSSSGKRIINEKKKPDFREILDNDSFSRFLILRKARKKVSEELGVPAFSIMTDTQMADMAKSEKVDIDSYGKLEGVGPGKSERFSQKLMMAYQQESDSIKQEMKDEENIGSDRIDIRS